MNLQHIKNIIKEQLDQLRYQKTLNEGIPQWIRDCCNQRKDRQCCDIVADNPGKQIPKDVLNKLKKRLSEQMGNSGCTPKTESITCDCDPMQYAPNPIYSCMGTNYVHNDCTSQQDCSCCPENPPFTLGKKGTRKPTSPTVYTPSPGSRPSGQTLNEGTKCPLSIQINCPNGTPCNASWQDGNGGSDGCVYSDCCGGGPQSIIPKGPNAPMAYQNKRR
jgi:hypothetical protein